MTTEERKAYQRKWYQQNRERVDAKKKQWRERNIDKVREYSRKYYHERKGRFLAEQNTTKTIPRRHAIKREVVEDCQKIMEFCER